MERSSWPPGDLPKKPWLYTNSDKVNIDTPRISYTATSFLVTSFPKQVWLYTKSGSLKSAPVGFRIQPRLFLLHVAKKKGVAVYEIQRGCKYHRMPGIPLISYTATALFATRCQKKKAWLYTKYDKVKFDTPRITYTATSLFFTRKHGSQPGSVTTSQDTLAQ